MEAILIIGAIAIAWIVIAWLVGRIPKPAAPPERPDSGRLYEIVARTSDYFTASASPADLLNHPPFMEGVVHLESAGYSADELLNYYRGDNVAVSCMALEALHRRSDRSGTSDPLLEAVNGTAPWTRFFVLRVLAADAGADIALLGQLLLTVDRSWEHQFTLRFLQDFVRGRLELGEKPTCGSQLEKLVEEQARWLVDYLPRLCGNALQPMVAEIQDWRARRIDVETLKSIGRVREATPPAGYDPPIEHAALEAHAARIESDLLRTPSRSMVLVGESGVGKSAIVETVAARMQQRGWTIFEAGSNELMAGMSYIGELEERLRELIEAIGGRRRVLWIVPDFHGLIWAGRHRYGPSSALDQILPFVEQGEVTLIGEASPDGWQRVLNAKPRCRTAVEVSRIDPLDQPRTLELCREWSQRHSAAEGPELLDEPTLGECWNLVQQFLGNKAAPGNVLQLLDLTRLRLSNENRDAPLRSMRIDDLIFSLSQLSGLPASILDDRENLDLAALRALFEARVMGQGEAVDCLVERVAMIKAGLTDPTRPQGVFLFAGPTGTGKTEIAKTLAEFLFGTSERLVRLDMSELQDEESLARLIGERAVELGAQEAGGALTDMIRRQPFSVILLDEFEKAHPRVWDLFLQVFDDGRLTDRMGRTADFRHALVILTSNLGSTIPSGLGLGFIDREGSFSADAVLRQVRRAFRPEFLNRLDRVLVFNPLSRETMRRILRKELDAVFRRRGLRNRSWAAEWDETAIDFLLEKGFTADLGARPLRRAIERYLLTPLAMTIVDHRFPEGEQFLFIRGAGSRLAVEFVDPDAPVADLPLDEVATAIAGPDGDRLEPVVLSPRGSPAEVELLRRKHDHLTGAIERDGLHRAKQEALVRTGSAGFWDSPERFSVLDRAEYLDRIEGGMRNAGSLLERLERLASRPKASAPREMVGRVAHQLWLIELACADVRGDRPHESFLSVEAGPQQGGTPSARSNDFARRLGTMYRRWADRRGMRHDVLDERQPGKDGTGYRLVLSISGFAAWSLLAEEGGLHLFELAEDGDRHSRRHAVMVRVAAQEAVQPPRDATELRGRGLAALATATSEATLGVVRYYREEPSPLVRDCRRGWRSGKLDRVLEGDFDLLGEVHASAGP